MEWAVRKNILKKILYVSAFFSIPTRSSLKSAVLYATVAPYVKQGFMQGWNDEPSFNFAAFWECHNINVVCFIIWYLPCQCVYAVLA